MKYLFLITSLICFSNTIFAQKQQKHMINSIISGYLSTYSSESDSTSFGFVGTYQYHYMDHIQVGFETAARLVSYDTYIDLGPIITYNLDKNLMESYYASVAMTLDYSKYDSSTNTSIKLSSGKRHKVLPNISFSPEIYLNSYSNRDGLYLGFEFLNFQIFF